LIGLLWLSEKDRREKTLVFRRTIDDLASNASNEAGKPWLREVKNRVVAAKSCKHPIKLSRLGPDQVIKTWRRSF
jgi:hypothetical protein